MRRTITKKERKRERETQCQAVESLKECTGSKEQERFTWIETCEKVLATFVIWNRITTSAFAAFPG